MPDYVFTKDDGRICCRYLGEDGKQHEKSFGRGDAAWQQANQYCEQWREYHRQMKVYEAYQAQQAYLAQQQAQSEQQQQKEVHTLKMLCDAYFEHSASKGSSQNHITAMKTVAETIFYQHLGADTPIKDINYGNHILPMLSLLKNTPSKHTHKSRSVVTLNRYGHFLKAFFNFAVKLGWLDKNPMALWEKHHEPKKDRALSVEDIHKLIEVSPPHLAWAIEVAYNTGARTGSSELLSLKWSDLDFEKGVLHIYATKTKKHRWLPLSDEFLDKLREKMAVSDCEYIISYNGKPIKSLRKSFNTACKKAEIAYPARMYDIRHRFASELLKSSVPVGVVSRAIGHSRVSTTTDVYLEVLPKEMFDIKDKLPKLG